MKSGATHVVSMVGVLTVTAIAMCLFGVDAMTAQAQAAGARTSQQGTDPSRDAEAREVAERIRVASGLQRGAARVEQTARARRG